MPTKKPYSPYSPARQKIERAKKELQRAQQNLAAAATSAEAQSLVLPRSAVDAFERQEILHKRNRGGRPKHDKFKIIRDGHAIVAKNSKALFETLMSYALDPKSEHHAWALKLLAERALPAGYFKTLGEAEVQGEKRQAGVVINVGVAQPKEPLPLIIDSTATEVEDAEEVTLQ